MTFQYVCFIIFAVLAYLIVTDQSIAKFVVLISKIVKLQFEKFKWIVKYHPQTPWARYLMWRQSIRIAKELEKEFGDGNRNS